MKIITTEILNEEATLESIKYVIQKGSDKDHNFMVLSDDTKQDFIQLAFMDDDFLIEYRTYINCEDFNHFRTYSKDKLEVEDYLKK